MYNALNARAMSLVFGTLIYATIRTGALFDVLQNRLLPGLATTSPLGFAMFGAVLQALSLIAFVTAIEKIVLLWTTRRIRGDWIYKSSSGNWGHVRISLEDSKLRYFVDLYLKTEDLLHVIEERRPATSIGHGYDKMTLYTGVVFYAWYYVPPTRVEKSDYPERQGILTVTRTLDPDNYSARWERTGVLGPSPLEPEGATAEVIKQDRRSPDGNFYFFVRKKTFLRHKHVYLKLADEHIHKTPQ